jgi:hypothetical protein
MNYRNINPELVKLALRFRELWVQAFSEFTIHKPEKCLEHKGTLLQVMNEIKQVETNKQDQAYFACLGYLVNAVFLSVQNYYQILIGADGSSSLAGFKMNIEQFLVLSATLDISRPSIQQLRRVMLEWKESDDINALTIAIEALNKIPLPVIVSTEVNSNTYLRRQPEENTKLSEILKEEAIVISIRFYIDTELWANPQIIKPEHQYSIFGLIKISKWPEGYNALQLTHVSTTNDSWMILSFPTIPYTQDRQINIVGSIVLKYAQSILDPPHAIRLMARFIGNDKSPVYPKVVGYDQLVLRVIDPKNFEYPTGYDKLNEKVVDIFQKVKNELPEIPERELNDFLVLLSSILNYQGYCFQYGEYKNQAEIREDIFRDNLIRFLSANPRLSSSIIKEGTIGGGRVEINYKGIIAELKVEKLISDRNKLIENYQQQPVAYASAAASQLSILCVLELTEKKYASAIAAKNVFFVAPPVHGFDSKASSSRVAVVFIDGNTKSPSNY